MTTHELAHKLLAQRDMPVILEIASPNLPLGVPSDVTSNSDIQLMQVLVPYGSPPMLKLRGYEPRK